MEKPVLYLDVLILLNLFINFLILVSAKTFLQQETKPYRIFFSALLGSLSSLVILLPELSVFSLLLQKLFLSLLMVIIAFQLKPLRGLFLKWIVFLGVSFLFGGFSYAIWYFITPVGMIYQNGVVYFPISVITLAITTIAAYLILWILSLFLKRNVPSQQKIKIEITVEDRNLTLTALIDTGHMASDVMTGLPVVICEYKAILPLISEEMKPFLDDFTTDTIGKWQKRVHIVPVQSVTGKGSVPAFRPDHFYLIDPSGKKKEKSVLIGVVKEKISNGEVEALLADALL